MLVLCTRKTVADEPGNMLIDFDILTKTPSYRGHLFVETTETRGETIIAAVVGGCRHGLDLHPIPTPADGLYLIEVRPINHPTYSHSVGRHE